MNSLSKQRTLATMTGFERYTKKTRRAMFLEEMEQVVPWAKLCARIEPHYAKPGKGRRAKELEQMLRIYFLQQWFNLSDPAVEEALYDSATLRQFVGIDLGSEPVPDETTVCKFRHLLEEHNLGEEILGTVNLHLEAKGVRITTGTNRGRDSDSRAQFDQKPRAEPGSGDAPGEEGEELVCVTNTGASPWCCTEDGRRVSRSRLTGAGFKPPSAAALKRRGSEQLGKRHHEMSGTYGEDERKRTVDDASLLPQGTAKTGADQLLWDQPGRHLFTASAAVGV